MSTDNVFTDFHWRLIGWGKGHNSDQVQGRVQGQIWEHLCSVTDHNFLSLFLHSRPCHVHLHLFNDVQSMYDPCSIMSNGVVD